MEKRLKPLITNALNMAITEFFDGISSENTESWDSLASVTIALSLEKEFDVVFTVDELSQLTSYEEIKHILISKGLE